MFGNISVYDRDTTPVYPKDLVQNKLMGTMITNDTWVKETFTVSHSFREEKAIFGNVRGTIHDYSKKRTLSAAQCSELLCPFSE